MDLIAGMQSRRMDEQRASLPRLPGLNNANPDILRRLSVEPAGEDAAALPDENFFEMLMRCQVRYLPPFDQISTSTILSNVIILCILLTLEIVLGHKTGRSAQRLAGHIASETQGANHAWRRFFFVDYAIAIGSTRRSESRGSFTSHRCQRSCCHILLERQNGFSITNPNVLPPSQTALIHDRNVCWQSSITTLTLHFYRFKIAISLSPFFSTFDWVFFQHPLHSVAACKVEIGKKISSFLLWEGKKTGGLIARSRMVAHEFKREFPQILFFIFKAWRRFLSFFFLFCWENCFFSQHDRLLEGNK